MNLKNFPFILLIALLLTPGMSFALGLGSISLKSALNQPLSAQIELLGARDQDLKGIDIRLASDGVYKRMGIERNPLVEKLQFSVGEANSAGQFFIDVKSPNTITEPFVNFLIEVNWNSGRLLREFTILLDPPVTLDEKAPAVEVPETDLPPSFTVTTTDADAGKVGFAISESIPEISEEKVNESKDGTEKSEVAKKNAEETIKAKKKVNSTSLHTQDPEVEDKPVPIIYKEVKKNEILWKIAESLRPENISVEQMMLALQRENPRAFYGSTVSQLKEGAVLRIADISTLSDITTDEAILEIARQHQEWLSSRKAKQANNAVAAESTNVELEGSDKGKLPQSKLSKAKGEPRLELVTPIEDESNKKDAQTNVALAAAEEKLHKLNVELTLANESVEASKRENDDLLNRLASLEEQMSAMQNLVQLKDAELARMQRQTSPDAKEMNEELPGITLDLHNDKVVDKAIIEQKTFTLKELKKPLGD